MKEENHSPSLSEQDKLKKQAALGAVDMIKSGMIVGLGTGSTVRFALEDLGHKLKSGQLHDIAGIPSSVQTEKLAKELGIPLTTYEEHGEVDLTVDGADEVDPQLNLIKGGGGALLQEKILAQASRRNVIMVDESKLSVQLGTLFSVPVEVLSLAWPLEAKYIESLGAKVDLRKSSKRNPYITDQGNFILDCRFGPIADLEKLAGQLNQRAALMEHGLFLDLATDVIVAGKEGIRHLKRESKE
jgi:ribose 5-phosphate isomerase A